MKTTKLMIMSGALLMMISCDNNERDNERKESKDHLESFVDSVEKVADERADHNWNELDRRYNTLEQRAETAYVNSEENELEDLRKIEARYEEAKIEGKKKEVELNQTAEMHIGRIESWRETNATANNRNNEMDDTVKESVDWLENNFEKLGSDMRARYERIRADVRTDDRG